MNIDQCQKIWSTSLSGSASLHGDYAHAYSGHSPPVVGGGGAAGDSGEDGPSQGRGGAAGQRAQDAAEEPQGDRNETGMGPVLFQNQVLISNSTHLNSMLPFPL